MPVYPPAFLAISIHKALASLDEKTRPVRWNRVISIHKALASLDNHFSLINHCKYISIHKALASLDQKLQCGDRTLRNFNPQGSREPRLDTTMFPAVIKNFNPQGSREPRPASFTIWAYTNQFQSTRLSRASTDTLQSLTRTSSISIHKALASLDGKNAQLFLHLCHIYMLHIIHLLQIVYQVEISSRNLIVFSGQL